MNYIVDNISITDIETIYIMSDEIKLYLSRNQQYIMNDFNFNNLNLRICIRKSRTNPLLVSLDCLINTSWSSKDSIERLIFQYRTRSIESLIKFLLAIFRDKFTYSKVLDTIIERNELEKKNKHDIALKYFKTGNKDIGETSICCVCYDTTFVKTICGHLLCRICYEKIEYKMNEYEDWIKECPMCRNHL